MKVISIWQPWASLIIANEKFTETRFWAAPKSLIGQRIGIASAKTIRPEQRLAARDPEFEWHYVRTGLPPLNDLPHGYLLGTVLLSSCEMITEKQMYDLTDQERVFGWWEPGRYAWRMRQPVPLKQPVRVTGRQGLWIYQE
jgi:hypothetical protein